jgi:tRNA wybutosine-synthesizing protein 2
MQHPLGPENANLSTSKMHNELAHAGIIVPKSQVKRIKTFLEQKGQYDRTRKIVKHGNIPGSDNMAIPTCIPYNELTTKQNNSKERYFQHDFEIIDIIPLDPYVTPPQGEKKRDLLRQSVVKWLETIPGISRGSYQVDDLLDDLPTHYMLYSPMLLLPSAAFSSDTWKSFLSGVSTEDCRRLYSSIASHFNITHIARNAPIPADIESNSPNGTSRSNFMRSPVNIIPLYGDFGPRAPIPIPIKADFDAALWVSIKQNGIDQVWAPLHTMFSRGNITEKARIFDLASNNEQKFSAVDLYSGIGYFSFSYAKAGASVVLGWEINPWSVEGMRRGAERNGWSVEVVKDLDTWHPSPDQVTKIQIFEMDNNTSTEVVERLRGSISPVSHVNCGLLPTSKGSWESAVQILDPILGGWIHIHENFRNNEILEKAKEVEQVVQQILDRHPCPDITKRQAKLEHIEKVKSYAPGVMHCVLDIFVCPVLS